MVHEARQHNCGGTGALQEELLRMRKWDKLILLSVDKESRAIHFVHYIYISKSVFDRKLEKFSCLLSNYFSYRLKWRHEQE